jgi:hypothetical protein
MNLAKVYNDNSIPFSQEFKGDKITIKAKGYIEMEYDEAMAFKSAPFNMEFDGMSQQKPESYKMIRVEGKPDSGNQVTAFKCMADGSLHPSLQALNEYVQKNHVEKQAAPEETIKKTRG